MNESSITHKKGYSLYCSISILFLLYVSGNYFVMSNYSISVLLMFAFVGVFSAVLVHFKFTIPSGAIAFFALSVAFLACSLITNTIDDLSSYIAILIQMLCAMMICSTIDRNMFYEKFSAIITILAIISILFWIAGMIAPSIAYKFPMVVRDDLNLRYYNAYVYVFWEETGWGHLFLSKRNAGIFWEPGVYQIFLNLALYLELKKGVHSHYNNRLRVGILVLTVLSTFSVGGYAIMCGILCAYLFKKGHKNLIWLLAGLVAATCIALSASSIINVKLFDLDYITSRLSLDQIGILFGNIKNYLFGNTFTGRNTITSTVWNSIVDSCLAFGMPFVIVLLRRYYLYCKNNGDGLLLFFVLIAFFSMESMIWRPFFLCFVFYSFTGITNSTFTKEARDEISSF